MPESANIARHLGRRAAEQPTTAALKIPRSRTRAGSIDYLTLSFAELDAEVAAWRATLRAQRVQPADRVLVMVRQGLPLVAAAFALFSHGAVPIVIDPGMGLKSFLSCVERSRPRVLLGIPFARLISRVFHRPFRTIEQRVPASGSPLARLTRPGPTSALTAASQSTGKDEPIFRSATDLAAILFTSGSTGAPKGVCYEHGMFEAQVRLIQSTYQIQPGEIDLPMLPIFALFNPALGMTTVVPEIDPSRPGAVDPAKIVQAIRQENVTNSFGSPTLWNKIADHCIQDGMTLPSLKRVLCAGAPVPTALWEKSRRFLGHGQLHSPYGATEALPVSSISAAEVAALAGKLSVPKTQGPNLTGTVYSDYGSTVRGTCVGRPVSEMQVKIIALHDGPIATLEEAEELPPGQIGEIIVSGPVVTKHYDALPEATAAAKIQTPNLKLQIPSGAAAAPDFLDTCPLPLVTSPTAASAAVGVWHRMGDCGYLDGEGRLWFCGRKAERVETTEGCLYTEPCEQVFRSEAGVARCALIGLGERPAQIPAIVIQPEDPSLSSSSQKSLARRLRERAAAHPATRAITRFYFHSNFPVDVRHNAKIHRLTLAKWAATQKPLA